ncbi:MAG: hypothetical protein ACRCZN_09760 [Lactococcus lactis]
MVWWGKIKKGRQLNMPKPKYFIYNYNINVDKVTNKFISDKLLVVNEDNIVKLTEAGREIYSKYLDLWICIKMALTLTVNLSDGMKLII